jgi:hypothetical protein
MDSREFFVVVFLQTMCRIWVLAVALFVHPKTRRNMDVFTVCTVLYIYTRTYVINWQCSMQG